MTLLSVNINKVATIRNARGGNTPNVLQVAKDCEAFGAQGITVHPRPDGRHIRYDDVRDIRPIITTEFNIEGYPNADFLALIKETKPHQVTLVPDPPDVLTSNAGWDTVKHQDFLKEIVAELKGEGARVSLFVGTDLEFIEAAKTTGTDRVELYTEAYADEFLGAKEKAIAPYIAAANLANKLGLGLNAGHDLDRENLNYFAKNIIGLKEVSIGHALISDALYLGLENVIQLYLRELR